MSLKVGLIKWLAEDINTLTCQIWLQMDLTIEITSLEISMQFIIDFEHFII